MRIGHLARLMSGLLALVATACGSEPTGRVTMADGAACLAVTPSGGAATRNPGIPLAALSQTARLRTDQAIAPATQQPAPVEVVEIGGRAGHTVHEAVGARLQMAEVNARPLRILALSAGGAWGAFGVGVLDAMRTRELGEAGAQGTWRRYDVVTGVSTGSMLAPLVYLGRERDFEILRRRYTTLTDAEVFRSRFVLEYFSAPSLLSTAPLRSLIESIVTDGLVDDVATEWRDTRRVLAVMAVNLNTGESEAFDLGAIAAGAAGHETPAARRLAFIDAVMASAAIPIGFTPVTINGCTYVDGGARQHLFVAGEIAEQVARRAGWSVGQLPPPRPGLSATQIIRPQWLPPGATAPAELDIIVNGDGRVSRSALRGAGIPLINLAKRVFTVIVDEGLEASVQRLRVFGTAMQWRVRGVDAEDVTFDPTQGLPGPLPLPFGEGLRQCVVTADNDDTFDPHFMDCLYRNGRAWDEATPGGALQNWELGVPRPALPRPRSGARRRA